MHEVEFLEGSNSLRLTSETTQSSCFAKAKHVISGSRWIGFRDAFNDAGEVFRDQASDTKRCICRKGASRCPCSIGVDPFGITIIDHQLPVFAKHQNLPVPVAAVITDHDGGAGSIGIAHGHGEVSGGGCHGVGLKWVRASMYSKDFIRVAQQMMDHVHGVIQAGQQR